MFCSCRLLSLPVGSQLGIPVTRGSFLLSQAGIAHIQGSFTLCRLRKRNLPANVLDSDQMTGFQRNRTHTGIQLSLKCDMRHVQDSCSQHLRGLLLSLLGQLAPQCGASQLSWPPFQHAWPHHETNSQGTEYAAFKMDTCMLDHREHLLISQQLSQAGLRCACQPLWHPAQHCWSDYSSSSQNLRASQST